MRSIEKIKNLKGKRVLLRVDFNVPVVDGKVVDDFRIKKSLPTIKYLLKQGAIVTLVTHLGKDGSESLAPVIARFFEISKIQQSKIKFYENVRKFPGEESNDSEFAKELAREGDIFVNDAFSVSHRSHASVVGVAKLLPSYAGFQLEAEVSNLSKAIKKPAHPFVFILGGAKFSTKMPLIQKYLKSADFVFVGGALANDFFKAQGYEVGRSLVDDAGYDLAKILKNKKLILPVDVVVENGGNLSNKKLNEISAEDKIIDVGSESIERLKPIIQKAKLVLWNGPMGVYESGGDVYSKKLLKIIAGSKAESIIGGGDTVALVSEMKIEKKISFVSTGGGATLDFLANGTLPGIKVLG